MILSGTLHSERIHKPNGWLVGELRDGDYIHTIVGILPSPLLGWRYELKGEFIEDPTWGRQFRFTSHQVHEPDDAAGLLRYLCTFPLIGPRRAAELVQIHGLATLQQIKLAPYETLRWIPGMTTDKAEEIAKALEQTEQTEQITLALLRHGLTPYQTGRLIERYGQRTLDVIRQNPYRVAQEMHGIGFRTADLIARRMGHLLTSPLRTQAGLAYIVEEIGRNNGHTLIPAATILEMAKELRLHEPEKMLKTMADTDSEILEVVPSSYSTKQTWDYERYIYDRLLQMNEEIPIDPLPEFLAGLTDGQQEAARIVLQNQVSFVTGKPGTGKTHLIGPLIVCYQAANLSVMLLAPTGKAARRITEKTYHPSATVHRALGYNGQSFSRDAANPLGTEVVIVDESSMVDSLLLYHLLRAVRSTTRLVFIGDPYQLPPVGPGSPLKDCVRSKKFAGHMLTEIVRQAEHSGIVRNAHHVIAGERLDENLDDFHLEMVEDCNDTARLVVEATATTIPEKHGLDPRRDIQVLTPMNIGPLGTKVLNEMLKKRLNPNSPPPFRSNISVGDKVIQTRNNYRLGAHGIMNGQVGVILAGQRGACQVGFDDEVVEYNYDAIEDLRLAYAITIHRAQGSEWPCIVVPIHSTAYVMLSRQLFYTAITRASTTCYTYANQKGLRRALRNNQPMLRSTCLGALFREERILCDGQKELFEETET